VLLAPDTQRVQAEQHLGGRGWTTQAVGSPLEAMAELCLLERGRDSRRAWRHDEPAADEALALVVVDPRSWPDLERLLRAARKHLPAVAAWELRHGAMSPLGAPAPPAEADRPVSRAAPPVDGDGRPPAISPEEISMLLEGNLHEGPS
jgi:hypothetical protein